MAALTWRDVAAPDFNTALAGYGVAGRNITDAGAAMSKGIGDFQADQQNTAAAQLAAASAKYQDSASLKAAMQNGSLLAQSGANPGYLTAAAYKGEDDRASTLLNQATGQHTLDNSIIADPIKNQGLRESNTQTELANELARKTQADNVGFVHERLLLAAQDRGQGKTKFDDSQAATAQTINAKDLASQAFNGAVTKEDFINNLAKLQKTSDGVVPDPSTRAEAALQASKYFPGSGGSAAPNLAPGGTLGAPGTAGAQTPGQQLAASANPALGSGSYYTPSSLGALYRSVGANPEEAQKLAAISYAESSGNPNAHNTRSETGDNSYGLAQINMLGKMGPERLAHFGLTKNEDLFDPRTNARVALQMSRENGGYNDWSTYKNGLHEQYLSAAGGGAANPDSADNPNIRATSQEQTSRALSLIANADIRTNQNNAADVQGNYAKTQAETELDLNGAAKRLADGSFAGVSLRTIRQKINEVYTESRKEGRVPVTYATAAAVVDNSSDPLTGSGSILDTAGWNPWRDATITSNAQKQTDELKKIGGGDSQKIVQENTQLTARSEKLKAALAIKAAAENDLMDTQDKARNRPDLNALIPDKHAKFIKAQQAVEALVKAATPAANPDGSPGEGIGTPLFKKPAPTQDAPPTKTAPNGAAPALAAAAAAGDNKPFDIGYAALHGLGNVVSAPGKARRIVTGVAGAGLSGLNEVLQGSPEHVLAQAQSMDDSSPLKQRIIAAQLKRIADREKQGN